MTIDIEQRMREAETQGESVLTLTFHEPGQPKAQALAFITPTLIGDYRDGDRFDRARMLEDTTRGLCDALAYATAKADGKPLARPRTHKQWLIAKANGGVPPDYPDPEAE